MSGYNSCMFAYGQVLVFSEDGLLFIIFHKKGRKWYCEDLFVIVFKVWIFVIADW